MKVIALRGSKDSGKTATMNALLCLFPAPIQKLKIDLNKKTRDFWVEFSYNNKKIGIISIGDPYGEPLTQKSFLIDFREHKCDVIVCVCRTRGKTVDLLIDIFGKSKIVFIRKFQNKNDDIDVAHHIFDIITNTQ